MFMEEDPLRILLSGYRISFFFFVQSKIKQPGKRSNGLDTIEMRRSCDGSSDHGILHIEVRNIGVDDGIVGIRVVINFFAALYEEEEETSVTRPCSR